jgi:hypothetical protein
MEKGHDYIPSADAEFTVWLDKLVSAVVEHTTGTPPEWNHILQEEVDALVAKQGEWHAAQDLAVSDPTSGQSQNHLLRKRQRRPGRLVAGGRRGKECLSRRRFCDRIKV